MKSLTGPCVLASWSRSFRERRVLSPTSSPTMVRGPACLKDDLRSLGIIVNVSFRGCVHVAAGNRASHEYDFLHQRNNGGILEHGERDVCQRAYRNQSDLMRQPVHHLDDEIRSKPGVNFALARRKLNVGKTVFAVPELRRNQLLKERMLGAGSNRDIAAI